MIPKQLCTALLVAYSVLLPFTAKADDPKTIPNKYADAIYNPALAESIEGGIADLAKTARYHAPPNSKFKSAYDKVALKTVAKFAYDLDTYNATNGAGWVHYKEKTYKYLPYAKQKEFAKTWWTKNDAGFAKDSSQDVWLHEAILDGTYLYNKYHEKNSPGTSSKEYMDDVLGKLAKEQ